MTEKSEMSKYLNRGNTVETFKRFHDNGSPDNFQAVLSANQMLKVRDTCLLGFNIRHIRQIRSTVITIKLSRQKSFKVRSINISTDCQLTV